MKEPEFIFDDKWLKEEKELKEILDINKDPEIEKNKYVLESFVRGAAWVFVDKEKIKLRNLQPLFKEAEAKQTTPQWREVTSDGTKYYKEVVNVPSGVDIYPVPVPSYEGNIQPIMEFKEVPVYSKKIIQKPETIRKRKPSPIKKPEIGKLIVGVPSIKKDLITDRITNKVLSTAEISDKYIVNEPGLDTKDINVLLKIKKKRKIKDVEKGWKLIQKYGKKFGIQEGHDTLIKYYLVNDFFGMGRIEPLLQDKDITKITCEKENKTLEIEINGRVLGSNILFMNKDELLNFVYGAADRLGVKLDKNNKTAIGSFRGLEFTLKLGDDLQNPSFTVVRK